MYVYMYVRTYIHTYTHTHKYMQIEKALSKYRHAVLMLREIHNSEHVIEDQVDPSDEVNNTHRHIRMYVHTYIHTHTYEHICAYTSQLRARY